MKIQTLNHHHHSVVKGKVDNQHIIGLDACQWVCRNCGRVSQSGVIDICCNCQSYTTWSKKVDVRGVKMT